MIDGFDPYYKWLGIPPKDQPPHHYRLLGIELFETDRQVILAAADRQARHVRTFQTGKFSNHSQHLLDQIADARECLLNAGERAEYDEQLRRRLDIPAPTPASSPVAGVVPADPTSSVPQTALDTATSTATEEPLPNFGLRPHSVASQILSRRRALPWWVGAAGLAGLCVIVLLAWVLLAPSPTPDELIDPSQGQADAGTTAGHAEVANDNDGVNPKTGLPKGVPERLNIDPDSILSDADPSQPKSDPGSIGKTSKPPGSQKTGGTPAVATVPPPVRSSNTGGPVAVVPPRPTAPGTTAPGATSPGVMPSGDAGTAPRIVASSGAATQPLSVNAGIQTVAEPARLAVPSKEDVDKSLAQIHDIYKSDYDTAKKTRKRGDLARKLFSAARQTNDDPVGMYALLQESREQAGAGGDFILALDAIGALNERFDVDALELSTQLLAAGSKQPLEPAARDAMVRAISQTMDKALAARKIEVASKLALLLQSAATRIKDVELRKSLLARAAEVKKLKQHAQALEHDPDDPAANHKYGEFLCCQAQDWDAGLPFLLKSPDARYAAAARLDLERPTQTSRQVVVADAWWDLAQSESGAVKKGLQFRAAQWYELVLPDLSGLNRTRLEKRLAGVDRRAVSAVTITGVGPPAVTTTVAVDPARAAELVLRSAGFINYRQGNTIATRAREVPNGPPFQLTGAYFSSESRISATDFAILCGANLESLDLAGSQFGDEYATSIARCPSLKSLLLQDSGFTDKGLAAVSRSLQLERLTLRGTCRFTPAGLAQLVQLPKLQFIDLGLDGLNGEWIAALRGFSALQTLHIQSREYRGEGLAVLSDVPGLTSVALTNVTLSEMGAQQLAAGAPGLQFLVLNHVPLTKTAFQSLGRLRSLNSLIIFDVEQLAADWLATLDGFDQLKTLSVIRANLSRADLFRLPQGWPALSFLTLMDCQVSDETLTQLLAAAPQLTSLTLEGTVLPEQAPARMAALSKLTQLSLRRTGITRAALAPLKRLQNLKQLLLSKGPLTDADMQDFKQALPQCNVRLE